MNANTHSTPGLRTLRRLDLRIIDHWPYVTMSVEQEDGPSTPSAGSGILRHIDVERLFNLPLYEHHLVIDTRSADDYSSGHIVSAVSYPSPPRTTSDVEREKTLIKFIKGYVKEYFRWGMTNYLWLPLGTWDVYTEVYTVLRDTGKIKLRFHYVVHVSMSVGNVLNIILC